MLEHLVMQKAYEDLEPRGGSVASSSRTSQTDWKLEKLMTALGTSNCSAMNLVAFADADVVESDGDEPDKRYLIQKFCRKLLFHSQKMKGKTH